MPVQIIHKAELEGTLRHVQHATYETYRFLLASDLADVTLTDILLAPAIEATYGYEQHIEIAYCIEGDAVLTDLATGQAHHITPGTLWVARPSQHFRFLARTPTRLICVFSPPFSGHETGFAGDQ